MARPQRPQAPGLTYHVTSRGNRQAPIYEDDADRYRFLGDLAEAVRRHAWTCHAYCLMTNHYHLLISTPEPNIGRGMQMLNGRYAEGFNRRHKLSGHLFQGRYHSVVIERGAHLLELFRYMALNPCRAGLCPAPEQWVWSSYRYALGLEEGPDFLSLDFLLECFSAKPERGRVLLRSFVRDRVEPGDRRVTTDRLGHARQLKGSDPRV